MNRNASGEENKYAQKQENVKLRKNNKMQFSWRTMSERQSSAITFSGDQTSGYYGESEYFDIDKLKELFSDAE